MSYQYYQTEMPIRLNNIINTIVEEIASDETLPEQSSFQLENFYNMASNEEKKIIDLTLIAICGWGFETLKEKSKGN